MTIQAQQVFSNLKSEGQIELSLKDVTISAPEAHEVVVEVQAAPITLAGNPHHNVGAPNFQSRG